MDREFGFRLLKGRQGMEGHVRGGPEGDRIVLRGLTPGQGYTLYQIAGYEMRKLSELKADAQGSARYAAALAGRYLVEGAGRAALWEDEGRPEENYLLAAALLARMERQKKAALQEEKKEQFTPPAPLPRPIEAAPIPQAEKEREQEASPPEMPRKVSYALRPAGEGEAADDLPPLIWPRGTEELQSYFDLLPPFAPMDWAGWRFIRAKSPVKACPFLALGYTAREGRVAQIAYALPGLPFHPPAPLPGYRYMPGRNGQGYWVLIKTV